MKKLFLLTVALMTSVLINAEELSTLRGDQLLDETSQAAEKKNWAKDGEPIPRNFIQQPPLIPHQIKGYQINLKFNKCMTCHSWKKYKEAGATKISQTHFKDRDGNDLATVSPRRYFCTQCHVPQATVAPIVENTFEPVESVSQ